MYVPCFSSFHLVVQCVEDICGRSLLCPSDVQNYSPFFFVVVCSVDRAQMSGMGMAFMKALSCLSLQRTGC